MIAGLKGKSMFCFIKKKNQKSPKVTAHFAFPLTMRVYVAPHQCQHLMPVFCILAILIGV